MRVRTKDGRWYDSKTAILLTDKLRYTSRGNWVWQRLAEWIVVEEYEAIEILFEEGELVLESPAFRKLPDEAQSLVSERFGFCPGDEV